MLVVVRQPAPRVLELLRPLDGMGVVEAQNPLAIWLVQGQRVTYAVRNVLGGRHPPCLDLDPVTITLVNDLVVEFDKSGNTKVFTHD